jgi:short-subunit dehydrogenase
MTWYYYCVSKNIDQFSRMRIDGKVILITGASAGIGAACAVAFRERGARLSLTARSQSGLEAAGGPDALITAGDITQEGTRHSVVDRTIERFGAIDVLINNAGIGLYAPSWRVPLTDVRRLFELNLFAPLALAQLVVPHMRDRRGGTIVNVGSIAGKVTLPWFTLYSASKHALASWTDGLRMELQPYGIHAMNVCPGYVKTGFQDHVLAGQPPAKVLQGKRFAITAAQCARAIVRGVERDARTVVTPATGWLFILAERLAPSFVDARMAAIYREAGSAE